MARYGFAATIRGRDRVPAGKGLDDQRQRLLQATIRPEHIYLAADQYANRPSNTRRGWYALMKRLNHDDQVVITEMAILGPQIADLIQRVLELHHAGASLYPLNDPDFQWLPRLADAPTARITEVLSGLLDFERRYTREEPRRSRASIPSTPSSRGRRRSLDWSLTEYLHQQRGAGRTWAELSRETGIPVPTIKRALNSMPSGSQQVPGSGPENGDT